MQLRLHNTLTRTKEVFEPIDPTRVRLYDCGPTVYQRIHVGNARSFVVFDVLYRLLRHLYGEQNVVYVRNITDIDDKIIDQAAKNGEDIRTLTERTTADFHADLAALGCLPPTHEPRATEHVPGMIALIQTLIERGHAYAAEGHVLFSVPSMPDYGRLSGRNRDEQIAGARVDVAPYKRDPADFVLWKPSTDDQPGWGSPWGHGRPGWHIECSAMSEHFLGPLPFDIHAGGLDLIFPHHENEIAQSCCAHGIDTMARYWLHNGFLDMRGEKMSKSLGNVVRVNQAIDEHSGEAVRLRLLFGHYRKPMDYYSDTMSIATQMVREYYDIVKPQSSGDPLPESEVGSAEPYQDVVQELCDDLNTYAAIVRLHGHLSDIAKSRTPAEKRTSRLMSVRTALLLGLGQNEALWRSWDNLMFEKLVNIDYVKAKIEERTLAKRAGDFARADEIRIELREMRIDLMDRRDGTTDWRRT